MRPFEAGSAGSQQAITILLTPAIEQLPAPEQSRYLQLLGPEEQERWRILQGRRKLQYLVGRAALRTLLSHCCPHISAREWLVRERKDRAPAVMGACAAGLYHSIAHSGDFVAVAVTSATPVGIDIECHKSRDFVGIAQQWFHPDEVESMLALGGTARSRKFYQLWTLKEATLKLIGASVFGDALQGIQPRLQAARPGTDQSTDSLEGPTLARKPFIGCTTETGKFTLAIVAAEHLQFQMLMGYPLLQMRSISPGFQVFTIPGPGLPGLRPKTSPAGLPCRGRSGRD